LAKYTEGVLSIDPAFGHWLAGFTDGEGAFVLTYTSSHKGNPHKLSWPSARFEITLRADDGAILYEIRDRLGFGIINNHSATRTLRPNQNPGLRYHVWRQADTLVLVDLFEQYPLRAKKRLQFEVWAAGVREITRGAKIRDADLLAHYRTQLMALRAYAA
jgi:hypothetical protein